MAMSNHGIDSDVEEQFQLLTIRNASTASAPKLQLPHTYTVHYKKPGGGKGAGSGMGAGSGLHPQERSVQQDLAKLDDGPKLKDSGLKSCYTCSTSGKWSKMLGFWVQDEDDWEGGFWVHECVKCVKEYKKSRPWRRLGTTCWRRPARRKNVETSRCSSRQCKAAEHTSRCWK